MWLRRLSHDPILAVVTKWLDDKECLTVHHELAEVIACAEPKRPLFPNDSSPWNGAHDFRHRPATKKKVANREAGDDTGVVLHFARLHDG